MRYKEAETHRDRNRRRGLERYQADKGKRTIINQGVDEVDAIDSLRPVDVLRRLAEELGANKHLGTRKHGESDDCGR